MNVRPRGESLERAAVSGWNGHGVVDREAGVVPEEEEARAVLFEQTGPPSPPSKACLSAWPSIASAS